MDDKNRTDPTYLKKGNINFDILKPEGIVHFEKIVSKGKGEKEKYVKKTKRGQFDRGRKLNPVGSVQIFSWAAVFLISFAVFFLILLKGSSLLWMIILPFVFVFMLWSLIMLALFKARPR